MNQPARPARGRLATLTRAAATACLPTTTDFLEPPERVLVAPTATSSGLLAEILEGFLLEHYATSSATGDTYASSLSVYVAWCSAEQVDPLLITRPQASRFASWLADTPSADTLRVRGPSRRNQILSACSSLIGYATLSDARPEWTRNPFASLKRPAVDKHPRTGTRLTVSHINQLVLAARADHLLGGVLGKLLVAVMARMGLRPGDACRLNLSGAADDHAGGYELAVPVKGGATLPRWLPPDMASDFATYLTLRVEPEPGEVPDPYGADPLFVHPRRRTRLNPDDLLRLLRRSATAARLPFATCVCSRDMRPFFNTLARNLGASLEERQVGLGHSSAVTTQRYDRTEWAREHDPAIRVSTAFEDYPAENRLGPLRAERRMAPPVAAVCDCTPTWPELHVDLSPVGVDQTAVCVITEEPEPGAYRLVPYCRRCRMAYPGPFRVGRVLEDPAGDLLTQARGGLAEAARYPDAVERREERRRGHDAG